VLAGLAARLGEAFVELGELVDLAHRIAERRHVEDAILRSFPLLLLRRALMREGTGSSLLARAQASVPQIDEGRIARLERREAKTVAGVRDIRAIELFDERVDACACLRRRPREPAREEHVVLRLELLEIGLEPCEIAIH